MPLHFEPFYQNLIDTLAAYHLAYSTMATDQLTIAPKKGAPRVNQALALLARAAFEIENDPENIAKIRDYAQRLPQSSLEKQEVELRLRQIDDQEAIPADFYQELIQTRADSGVAWHEAKEQANYKLFQPHLEKVIANTLKAQTYSPRYNGTNSYDLALDAYEAGMDQKQYDEFFAVIKEELIPFIAKVQAAQPIDTTKMNQVIDAERQAKFAQIVMDYLQADPERVYLSTTEHPFTEFFSNNDVRITTRYIEDNFLGGILSIVHEYGHALYSLNANPDYDKTMFIDAIGSGAHETQSRFLENHIGRSKAFWSYLYPTLIEHFPEFKDTSLDELIAMINASSASLIRTEADELTYPLHILIRYEIEKQMANGTLDYDHLPQLWADLYEQYLGIRPSNDQEGVLQDIHWSDGGIGYFPTYALGSAYAAQLYEAMEKELDVDQALENGHIEKVVNWLKENVQQYGAQKTMRQIVEEVSHKPFDPHVYTNYLKNKYTKLYHLEEQ
ncbi:carboxypeptidase M32 [Allobaculum stercoricanis]|uniref:carboxypeptidase M32 n=1 Tax=Allobaculum stercoricanis TaxID=174709 RepID=UPI00248E402A|nr:carboxypeptidase M32 [Allobaculum stercoricanis]